MIRAFNADLPYDEFVREQIAGDLVLPPRLDPLTGANESILGTGFWWLGEEIHSPVRRAPGPVPTAWTAAWTCSRRTFLGLTVACARCHDHKFDAISQRDYYALTGFQSSSTYRQVRFETMEEERAIAGKLAAVEGALRAELAPLLARELARDFLRIGDCLLAAREYLLSPQGPDADDIAAAIAERWQIEPATLRAWVSEIERAREESGHPLAIWAESACTDDRESGPEFAQRLLRRLEEHQACALSNDVIVRVDPARLDPDRPWIEDGFAWGGRVRRAGELCFTNDALDPIARVQEWSAARFEPAWSVLELATDDERDPGALKLSRSGRTWVSPTFTLAGKKLYLLVRGAGICYAAVDGHKMIEGPLHARLVASWEGGLELRWVEQDLSDYAGHRVHLELTPAEGFTGEFALVRAVEADAPPPLPLAGDALALELARLVPANARELASAYGSVFSRAIARFEASTSASIRIRASRAHPTSNRRPGSLSGCARTPSSAGALRARARARGESTLGPARRAVRLDPAPLPHRSGDARRQRRRRATSSSAATPRRPGDGRPAPASWRRSRAPRQPRIDQGSGRLELRAGRCTDPDATRSSPACWSIASGTISSAGGSSRTVDDFGVLGEPPTHPELLDYLAERFVADGWSIKRLIRAMVLSQHLPDGEHAERDAAPRSTRRTCCCTTAVRRLEARRSATRSSPSPAGSTARCTGRRCRSYLTPFMDGRGRPAESGPLDGDGRRSIYLAVRRNFLSPLLLAFDYPPSRSTDGPAQRLERPGAGARPDERPVRRRAGASWADACSLAGPATTDAERVECSLTERLRPSARATGSGRALSRSSRRGSRPRRNAPDEAATWAELCHVLINVKEFIYIQ